MDKQTYGGRLVGGIDSSDRTVGMKYSANYCSINKRKIIKKLIKSGAKDNSALTVDDTYMKQTQRSTTGRQDNC